MRLTACIYRDPPEVENMLRCIVMASLLLTACYGQDISRMEQVVQYYASNGQFMGSVLVARDKEVLLDKGYGSANLEWSIPNTPSTKFRLGSITKQFTAAAILLLEERGKLKVEDPIGKYLPDAPATWDKMTIFHALTHTAGIPNYTSFPEYSKLEPFPITPVQIVALFRDKPLDFTPGEKMQYSNSGYALLGYVIEKVSGESYRDFLQSNIFAPLGMQDTGYDSNSAIIPRRAAGYAPGPKGPENAGFVHMSIPFSAGALYSTTEDLLRWESALFNGKLLSSESLAKMTAPYKDNYAFGLMVRAVNGRKVIEHGGGIEGFNTYLAYYPESKVTVVVLGNLNGSVPERIGNSLAAVAHGDAVVLPSERKEVTVLPNILEEYVGTYQLAPRINLMITVEDGQLMAQVSGQSKAQLAATSDVRFFFRSADADIEFTKDEKGTVVGLTLLQGGGQGLKAPKTSDRVPVHKEITLSPTILAQYVGTYEIRPGFDLTISLEDNQLMTQATGQPKFPLFAESEARFFLKVVDAEIEFVKDDKGVVRYLIHHQGASEIKAPKK